MIMQEMIRYFDGDVRRINHALKVYTFTDIIAADCEVDDRRTVIIGIAAILHDIGIKEAERKFNSSSWKFQFSGRWNHYTSTNYLGPF